MIYKYIVTWCLISYQAAPNKVVCDEFGRTSIQANCALIINKKCDNKKEFKKDEDAWYFYNNAKSQMRTHSFQENISEVKIDSVIIKK